jgi:hypothetical protein
LCLTTAALFLVLFLSQRSCMLRLLLPALWPLKTTQTENAVTESNALSLMGFPY